MHIEGAAYMNICLPSLLCFLWMSLFPIVVENIDDVWSFLLLGILQLGVCVSVWGGDVGLFCSAYHTSFIPEHSFSSI